jgi:hypothetical protein
VQLRLGAAQPDGEDAMRLHESMTALIVAVGVASAAATWIVGSGDDARGDRLASLRQPADARGEYVVVMTPPTNAAAAREITIRNSAGQLVYVSGPQTATTTVMRGTSVPALDSIPRPASSLERAYAARSAKGDRLRVASGLVGD